MMPAIRARLLLLLVMLSCHFIACAQRSLLDSVINRDMIFETIGFLSADSLYGRFIGTTGNARAAAFIADQFQKAGAHPLKGNNGYFMPFAANAQYGTMVNNVVAVLPGKSKPEELIIFSAHFDHVGTEGTNPYPYIKSKNPERGDKIYNGANDNASGVSALIALARYFGALHNNERTILFVAFNGEELGMLGSTALASAMNPESIVAVINLEMLGGHSKESFGWPFITGHKYTNLREILNKELSKANRAKFGKAFFSGDTEMLFARSDNFPFAQQGIPAHTIMAGSTLDDRYHTPEDEAETLNINRMTELIRAIALAVTSLVDGRIKPSRITAPDIFPGASKKNP